MHLNKMKSFSELLEYDLLAKDHLIKTEFGGRQDAVHDGYRGQSFWHINNVNCSDWDASYFFENGPISPGEETMCKIVLSENVKKHSNGVFPVEHQFGIREGARIVATGVILESKVNNA
jgi:translation elongation factor EF-Tu-like GTPase